MRYNDAVSVGCGDSWLVYTIQYVLSLAFFLEWACVPTIATVCVFALWLPWIPELSTVNNKLKRREGSGSTGRFFD